MRQLQLQGLREEAGVLQMRAAEGVEVRPHLEEGVEEMPMIQERQHPPRRAGPGQLAGKHSSSSIGDS